MAIERRACTVPEARLRAMLGQGISYEGIARVTGHKSDTLRVRAIALRVATPRPRPPEPPREEAMRNLLSIDGVTCADLARAFGLTPDQFRAAARRFGLPTDAAGRAALRDSRS